MSGIIGKNASRSSGVIGTAAGGIASLAADSSPQLGGFLDAAGNYIQMEKGGDISSASPTVIDTDGDFFAVTGTTNFSAFTVAADRHFFLEFGAVLTMTHGNGTLDLPGAANITTAASDVGEFVSTAANVVTCVNYTKRDGTAVVLADNSITLAKMAGGTDGNIISYDASGDPVAIATGNDGQVLTSTGAGSPPAFEAAAGGGAWTLIGTSVASASASLIITGLDSTYDTYAIALSDIVPATDGRQAWLRVGDSSGIDVGSTDYGHQHRSVRFGGDDDGSTTNATDTKIELAGHIGVGSATGEGLGGMITLHRPGDGTVEPNFTWEMFIAKSDGELESIKGAGVRLSVITLDRVQFLFNFDEVASGRMTVWGISHA